MRHFTATALVTLCLAFLASCASGPKFADASFAPLAPGKGRVFVYRTTTFGAAIQPMVMVDGREAGRAKPKGFLTVDLPAGSHTFEIKTEVTRNATVTVVPGQTSYVRVDVQMGLVAPRFPLTVVPAAKGAGEVARCKQVQL